MNAADLLERQTRRQLDAFVEAVRSIPADKMAWKPSSGVRSALDLLQECATINDLKPDLYETRKWSSPPRWVRKWSGGCANTPISKRS